MTNISVIIRTRNEERWIGHAIQSVLNHLPNSEIIIVDNKSNDETINIVRHFIRDPNLESTDENKYTNIEITQIEDYTPGKALNFGIKKASNETCIILSAHCVINKIDISKHINDLNNYVAIFGNQIPVWNGKKITKRYIWSHFIDEEKVNMYSQLENRYFLHNAVAMYKKSFLLNNPFDENLLTKEDRYWAKQIINKNHNILYDPELEVSHHYTINGNTWKGLA